MSWPLVQFVDAPTDPATVRHDFNDLDVAQTWIPREGFSFGVPQLEGDPDSQDSDFGLRQGLQFLVYVAGPKSAAMAVKAAMTRELMRRTNWLKFQLAPTTAPVFIPTFRTVPEATDVTYVDSADDSDDVWSVVVRLNAKPFALGLSESFSVSISSALTSSSATQQIALPALKGDVAVPLNLSFSSSTGPWRVSLAPQDTATLNRWSAQTVESSGSTSVVSAPSAIAPGRYRVYAVMPTASAVAVKFGWAPDGNGAHTIWNTAAAAGFLPYVMWDIDAHIAVQNVQDLGEVQFIGAPGSTSSIIPKFNLQRQAGSGTTTATLIFETISDDRIDEDASAVDASAGLGTGALWLGDDATHATVYVVSGQTFQSPVVARGASTIVAHPQHANILTFFNGGGSSVTATCTYQPRYLDVPAG
jgi:hypothetical protein